MLNNRRNTQERKSKTMKQSQRSIDQSQHCKLSGWNSQQFNDYFSYGILNYFKQSNTRCQSFIDEDDLNSKPIKANKNDQNKPNPKMKNKPLPSKNISVKCKSQSQSQKEKLIHHLTSQNQSKELKASKLQGKQSRRDSSCRISNFTQRMMTKKQYPRSIFQFKQTRKQLQQINYNNPLQLSQRNSNVLIEDNKGMNVLPRIKPFLNANKLLKLQSLNQRKLSPIIKSSRLTKHNNSQFIQQFQPVFDDQKIYCVSVHCLDD